jgi:hypothetical protein
MMYVNIRNTNQQHFLRSEFDQTLLHKAGKDIMEVDNDPCSGECSARYELRDPRLESTVANKIAIAPQQAIYLNVKASFDLVKGIFF